MKILGPWTFYAGGWYRIMKEDDDDIDVSFEITHDPVFDVYTFWMSGVLSRVRQYFNLDEAKKDIDEWLIKNEYVLIDDIKQWNKLMVIL